MAELAPRINRINMVDEQKVINQMLNMRDEFSKGLTMKEAVGRIKEELDLDVSASYLRKICENFEIERKKLPKTKPDTAIQILAKATVDLYNKFCYPVPMAVLDLVQSTEMKQLCEAAVKEDTPVSKGPAFAPDPLYA